MSGNVIVNESFIKINGPLDARFVINTLDDVDSIRLPAIGDIFYCIATDKYYKIVSLADTLIPPLPNPVKARVGKYKELVMADEAAYIHSLKFTASIITFSAEATPIYLVTPKGYTYNLSEGLTLTDNVYTLDTTIYRAYENLKSTDVMEFTLYYVGSEINYIEPSGVSASGPCTVTLNAQGNPNTAEVYVLTSLSGVITSWQPYTIGTTFSLKAGDYVLWWNKKERLSVDSNNYYHFTITGNVLVYGSLKSLINYTDTCTSYCFYKLFTDCSTASFGVDLDIDSLAPHCYDSLLYGCSSTALPITLPSEVLVEGCYNNMFFGCSSLQEVHVNFKEWEEGATTDWLKNVSDKGLFYKPCELLEIAGDSNIPSGWVTIVEGECESSESSDSSESGESDNCADDLATGFSLLPDTYGGVVYEYNPDNRTWVRVRPLEEGEYMIFTRQGGYINAAEDISGLLTCVGRATYETFEYIGTDSYVYFDVNGINDVLTANYADAGFSLPVAPDPYDRFLLLSENTSSSDESSLSSEASLEPVVCSSGAIVSSEINVAYPCIWEEVTVSLGGQLNVLSGGQVNSAVIARSGRIVVSDGGAVNTLTVNSSGWITVSSGGVLSSDAIINYFGYAYVYGEASGVTVNSMGFLYVDNGGVLDDIAVNSAGRLTVSSGGTATNVLMESRAQLTVFIASDTYFKGTYKSSSLEISGSVFSGYTLSDYFYIVASDGAVIANNTLYSGASAAIGLGGTAVSNNIKTYFYVYYGGVASGDIVDSYGYLHVGSGGSAKEPIISSGGTLWVARGGTVTGFVAHSRASINLTVAPDTYVQGIHGESLLEISSGVLSGFSGGSFSITVSSGGTISDIGLLSYGSIAIDTGGSASNLTISAGSVGVYRGGNVDGVVLGKSGTLYVSSGGTALNVDWTPFVGSLNAGSGAVVTYANTPQGVYLGSNNTLISSSLTMSGITLSSGRSMYVMSDGIAINTTISGYYAGVVVSSGGTVNSAVVKGGHLSVSDGGYADYTIISSGHLSVAPGGLVSSVAVLSAGSLTVASGGTALNLDWTPFVGSLSAGSGAVVTYVNTPQGVYLGSSNTLISSSLTMSGITLSDIFDSMYVMSDGIADAIELLEGHVVVSNGGIITNTVVSEGWLVIGSGGVATSTTMEPRGDDWTGGVVVERGGFIENTVLSSNCFYLSVAGGTANSTVIYPGASADVSMGGKMNYATVAGTIWVYGGTATEVTVSPGGYAQVGSGGLLNNIVISSAARLIVRAGGSASNVVAEDGSYFSLEVSPRSYLYGSQNGSTVKIESSLLSGYTISSRNSVDVASGGTALDIAILGGTLWASRGCNVSGITLTEGALYVERDGSVDCVTVGSGATLNVSAGGTATRVTSLADAIINVATSGYIEYGSC